MVALTSLSNSLKDSRLANEHSLNYVISFLRENIPCEFGRDVGLGM